jgi:NitT/TauT family transport system ATP-binding protein
MVRWGQAEMSVEGLKTAIAVFRPDIYDDALSGNSATIGLAAIGAFAGPTFNPEDIEGYLAAFEINSRSS